MEDRLITRSEAEDLLYLEARLIDEKRFEEWLGLFTQDARYWVPSNPDMMEPEQEVSIIYDDRTRLEDRVFRLGLPSMLAQNPSSRTTHLITNVELLQADVNQVVVQSCFTIHEVREGDWRQRGLGTEGQQLLVGRYLHHLRLEHGTYRIQLKKAMLLQSKVPITNLSFLV